MTQMVENLLHGSEAPRLCRAAASGWQALQFGAEEKTG
jgi:hypothetical protein